MIDNFIQINNYIKLRIDVIGTLAAQRDLCARITDNKNEDKYTQVEAFWLLVDYIFDTRNRPDFSNIQILIHRFINQNPFAEFLFFAAECFAGNWKSSARAADAIIEFLNGKNSFFYDDAIKILAQCIRFFRD